MATFGAGCFWGPELMFARVPGVVSTEVGYSQGTIENPTYEDVCTGLTGHNEVVQVGASLGQWHSNRRFPYCCSTSSVKSFDTHFAAKCVLDRNLPLRNDTRCTIVGEMNNLTLHKRYQSLL